MRQILFSKNIKSHTLTSVIFLLTYFYTLCIIDVGGVYGK
nr:MAG TPA: hypothetical protein [Caudoviricetes sp.]